MSLSLWIRGSGRAWPSIESEPEVLASPSLPIPGTQDVPTPPRVEVFRLHPGHGHTRDLVPGLVHSYPFDLRPGEFLRLVFDQQDVDIIVDVIDPMNHKILEVDTLNGIHGPEDVPFVAEASGIYDVRISTTLAGQYSPRIVARRTATSRDRTLAASVLEYFRGEEASQSNRPEPEIENHYMEAARLAGEVGETVHRADAYYRLGGLQCKERRWSECRDSYLSSLALYEDMGNLSRQAVVLTEAANAIKNLGETDLALKFFYRSVDCARKAHRVRTEAIALLNLGLLQLEQGEVEPALRSFELSRDLGRKVGDHLQEARALNASGRLYTFIGRSDKALALHDEAWKILQTKPDVHLIAETLLHIGDAYREGDRLFLATSYYLRALSLFRKQRDLELEADTLNNLGLTYFHSLQYRDALASYLQAIRIFHEHGLPDRESVGWSNVGWIQISLEDIPQSFRAFETSLTISQRLKRRPVESAAYFGMAWAERHRHNPIAAKKNVLKAIEIVESLRREAIQPELRRSLLGSRLNFYEFLVELLMEQHQIQPASGHDVEAFDASERARARSLLETLGEQSAPPVLSLKEIQRQVVDDDTILLEYHLGDEKSFLWAVTPGSYTSFELPGRLKIESLAREVYGLMKKSDGREVLPDAARKSHELGEILLGPVARRLGDKRLLFVTPPALQYVSFAALPDPSASEQGSIAFSWPTPLMIRHEIISAPSASVVAALRSMRAGRSVARNLLAVIADPVYVRADERLRKVVSAHGTGTSGADLLAGIVNRLKYSHGEAEAIARVAGGGDVLKLLDFEANRDQVMSGRLRSYRYLHFSVHGDPDVQESERSSIVLSAFNAEGQPRDPFLRAKEIQALGLSADLVVLSACGSGLGREVRGEGLVGLTQAFLSGGASGVMVSLWDVDDLATSEIMPLFYSNLLKKGLKPSAALRQAQISMWRQHRWNAPFYWAGFVELGDWR